MTFADAANDNAPLVIPYRPRRHFLKLHATEKRWMFVCAHRRAGKTVALANHLVRAAYLNGRAVAAAALRLRRAVVRAGQGPRLVLPQAIHRADRGRALPRGRARHRPSPQWRDHQTLRRHERLRAHARHVLRRHRPRRVSAPAEDRVLDRRPALPRRLSGLRHRQRHLERRRPLQRAAAQARWRTSSGGTCSSSRCRKPARRRSPTPKPKSSPRT